MSHEQDFVPVVLSREQADRKFYLAKFLEPFTDLGKEHAWEIKSRNRSLSSPFPELADLVDLYLVLEEFGGVLKTGQLCLSFPVAQEWVSVVNLALEGILKEEEYSTQEQFRFYREMYQRIFPQNCQLLEQKPPNIFYSLSFNLRQELERIGLDFSISLEKGRRVFAESLQSNPVQPVLVEQIVSLSWLASAKAEK